MLNQRNNGSLLDSPATTAAALIYHDQHDEKCFGYLNSILKLHKNWVPTIYPTKVHSYLCLVDAIQNLGVEQHFKTELKSILDEVYRLWQQKNEEIFLDVTNCAMTFRLLRMNNYEVSSEELSGFVDQEHFFTTSNGQLKSHAAILELHQASQTIHDGKDNILDKIYTWTKTFMVQKLLDEHIPDRSKKEMELALRKFYATYDRVETRRYIETYEMDSFKILKAAYRPPNINNIDFPKFSVHDFNLCQAQHREDLQQLKRWFEDCRLGQVKLSQQYLYTSYFMITALLFEPEYSDTRLAYAKLVMLITVVDDFFDGFVCRDELHNIIELVERWDGYSESVEIFFSALYQTIVYIAAKAHIKQGQSIKDHLINMWLDLLKCMLLELDWSKSKTTPSIEEYLAVACVTSGAACFVLTAQYLLGPKLSKEIIQSSEISALCNCTVIVGRLLNDIQSYKVHRREKKMWRRWTWELKKTRTRFLVKVFFLDVRPILDNCIGPCSLIMFTIGLGQFTLYTHTSKTNYPTYPSQFSIPIDLIIITSSTHFPIFSQTHHSHFSPAVPISPFPPNSPFPFLTCCTYFPIFSKIDQSRFSRIHDSKCCLNRFPIAATDLQEESN